MQLGAKTFIAYATNQCSWMKMNDMNNREQKRNTVGFAPCACWFWHNSFCGGKNGCSSNHPILCFKDYHFCLSASWVSGKMWPTPSMANVQWWHVRNLYSYGRLVVMEGRLFHCCGNVVFVRSLYQQWKSIEYLIIYQCPPLINQWVYKWIAFKLSIGMIMWICWI